MTMIMVMKLNEFHIHVVLHSCKPYSA